MKIIYKQTLFSELFYTYLNLNSFINIGTHTQNENAFKQNLCMSLYAYTTGKKEKNCV